MKNSFRIFFASFVLAILFFALYKTLGHFLFESRLLDMRKNHFLGLARAVQSAPDLLTAAQNIERNYDQITGTKTVFWIVNESKDVIFSSSEKSLSKNNFGLQSLSIESLKQNEVLEFKQDEESHTSILVFTRLPDRADQILVVESSRRGFFAKINSWIFIVIMLSAASMWLIANLFLTFYIRRKNKTIQQIIDHFEKGHFGKRFHRNWFDKLLGLFRDFNTMSEKLETAFVALQQVEAEKNQLMQELTHDLRTPLTSLRTASEILADPMLSSENRSTLLKLVVDETKYLNQLIEDLFFLSEISLAHQKHALFSIQDILEDEINRYKTLQTHLNFQLENKEGSFKIQHNEVLFRRLISNLIKNSVQVGSQNLNISCEKNSSELKLVFSDDGPGMTDEQIAQYGQKNKVRSFSQKDFKGSLGLGTVIVHRIVKSLQGEIVVSNKSRKNNDLIKGLCVQITIPLKGLD